MCSALLERRHPSALPPDGRGARAPAHYDANLDGLSAAAAGLDLDEEEEGEEATRYLVGATPRALPPGIGTAPAGSGGGHGRAGGRLCLGGLSKNLQRHRVHISSNLTRNRSQILLGSDDPELILEQDGRLRRGHCRSRQGAWGRDPRWAEVSRRPPPAAPSSLPRSWTRCSHARSRSPRLRCSPQKNFASQIKYPGLIPKVSEQSAPRYLRSSMTVHQFSDSCRTL